MEIPVKEVVAGTIITDPVSYTHLRAHETVLDLVCRLLLEKKKPPIFYLINLHDPTPFHFPPPTPPTLTSIPLVSLS